MSYSYFNKDKDWDSMVDMLRTLYKLGLIPSKLVDKDNKVFNISTDNYDQLIYRDQK